MSLTHVHLKVLSSSTLIVTYFGAVGKENFYDRISVSQKASEMIIKGAVQCPNCGGELTLHNCYARHLIEETGERHDGWVAQCRCPNCNTYPSLIPDFLMPYKHYIAEVIEATLSEDAGNLSVCPADDSTIRRWSKQFQERGARAIGWLFAILLDVYERHMGTLEMRNKSLMYQLERLLWEFPTRQSGTVISRVNRILTGGRYGYI